MNNCKNIQNTIVEKADFEENSFDYIEFWHVLEHLENQFLY